MEEDEERRRDTSDESDVDDGDVLNMNVYEDMVELPPPEDKELFGWTELRNKQLRSALVGACKRMPRNSEAHFHLGLMYLRSGEGTDALKLFKHCKKLYAEKLAASNDNPPPGLLANMARLRCHIAHASRLDAASRTDPDEKSKLLQELQSLLLESSDNLNTWNSLALLHLLEGGEKGARDILRGIRDAYPDYLDAINNLGLAELYLGNEREATKCFQEVVLRDRAHLEALSNYGVILLQHGMFEHAATAFEDTLKEADVGRGLSYAWCGLAIAKAGLGRMQEAEWAAKEAEATAVESHDKARMSMLVQSIMARKSTDEMLHSADVKPPALSKNTRPALDVAVTRLRGLAKELDSAAASTALGLALRLRHEFSIEETGNRSFGAEAAERLVEALERSQDDASAWTQLALLQMGSGEYASAREFALQACARNENLPAAWNTLGVTSQLINEVEFAGRTYEKALGAVLARESYALEGNVLEGKEESQVSASGLMIAATIWNNIGNLWRQEGGKFEEARDAYEKSLLAGGEHAIVYNNLALLYISIGRFDEAEHMLNRALRLDPTKECAISNRLKLKVLKKMKAGRPERS